MTVVLRREEGFFLSESESCFFLSEESSSSSPMISRGSETGPRFDEVDGQSEPPV